MHQSLQNLGLRELNHELGNLMVDVHHLEDGGSVVGDGNVAVLGHHQLVQA